MTLKDILNSHETTKAQLNKVAERNPELSWMKNRRTYGTKQLLDFGRIALNQNIERSSKTA